MRPMLHRIERRDNLAALAAIPDRSVPLIYIDPPFNTGRAQRRTTLVTRRDPAGDRIGFGGHRYTSAASGSIAYPDTHDDYLAFLGPRLREGHRVLAADGSFYLHLDYRESHYAKVLMDDIFGRDRFMNQIVWAYDYGGRSRRRWPAKHDVILFYVKDPAAYVFDTGAVDREPYMAPGLVTAAKVARGKLPTDVWWHTIVSPTGREKTGYPTQKPVGVLRRIVAASSRPGDLVLDYFAGSGTTGAAALELGRRFHLVDSHPDAVATMVRRFAAVPGLTVSGTAD
ncbi:MAG: site-specific DNA-methyltransferase [Chloroflexia bacterium]|nr:site-specific DNA-methyltransferase [Chloroflexia bacterium]